MARGRPGALIYQHPDGKEERFRLDGDVTTIGRSDTCTVCIPLPTVSRLHATIQLEHDRYVLIDSGSANGTFVGGARVEGQQRLSTGAEIRLGPEVVLQFFDPEETQAVTLSINPEPLLIDEYARVVQVYRTPITLSPLEYKLLLYLAQNARAVCTREACFQVAWGQPYDHATCEDALNACVAKLRRNLRAGAETTGREPPPITTIPRIGFRLDADVTFAPQSDGVNG